LGEGGEGEGGEGADVTGAVGLHAETGGGGDPGESRGGREVIEEVFGEPGSVVVAGAEKEDLVRHGESIREGRLGR
jgi:hypothetical protein